MARASSLSGSRSGRRWVEAAFVAMCLFATTLGFVSLAMLLYGIGREGLSSLDWQFLTSYPSRFAEKAGVLPALVGTLWLLVLTAVVTVPLGIASAVYLEEFAPRNRLTDFIQLNIANLAGVPSIVYGLLGLAIFVRTLQLERSVISGALTMSLLILPMVITASREALKAVPDSYREGSLALGATTWETVRSHVLPTAAPGMLTGIILGLSRAIGEAAPLITIGAFAYVNFLPTGLKDKFTVLPIQIFNWSGNAQEGFQRNAAAAIIVLLVVLLLFNSAAIFLRYVAKKRLEQ